MAEPRPVLTPARRTWLLRLRDEGPASRDSRVGFDCMRLGWSEWVPDDPLSRERITALGRRVIGDEAATARKVLPGYGWVLVRFTRRRGWFAVGWVGRTKSEAIAAHLSGIDPAHRVAFRHRLRAAMETGKMGLRRVKIEVQP